MKSGKLINDRYFYDDSESGLLYDLLLLFPQHYGDADELENAINERTAYAQTVAPAGACTLGLLQRQYEELEPKHQAFADKCYLMWFNSVRDEFITEINIHPWDAYGRDVFLWNGSPNEVLTSLTADGLSHRFRKVPAIEAKRIIDEWKGSTDPGGSSGGSEIPEYPEPYPDVIVADPVKKWRAKGKFWFMDVDLTVEAEE